MRWKWKHLVLNKCNLKIWCLEDSVKSLSFAHCYRDYSLVGNEAFRCVCVLLHFSAYNLWHFYTTHPSFHFSLSLSLSLSLSASAQPFLGSRNKPSARILRWNSEFFRFGMNLGGRWEVQRFSFRFAVELLEWRELKGVCVFGGEDCGLRRLFYFFPSLGIRVCFFWWCWMRVW